MNLKLPALVLCGVLFGSSSIKILGDSRLNSKRKHLERGVKCFSEEYSRKFPNCECSELIFEPYDTPKLKARGIFFITGPKEVLIKTNQEWERSIDPATRLPMQEAETVWPTGFKPIVRKSSHILVSNSEEFVFEITFITDELACVTVWDFLAYYKL